MASTATAQEITLRPPEPADTDDLARIVFEAFGDIHDHHRFQRDFPAIEAAAMMMAVWIPHPQVWGVVAELDGKIVGSNFLDERDPIRGRRPDHGRPTAQNAGVGRRLMEAVIERGKDAPGHPAAPGRLPHALALALHVARLRRQGAVRRDAAASRATRPPTASRCGR